MLRVEGATHRPLMRYVLIFRLNRPYPRWPKDPDDPDGPAPLPEGAADPLGNYSIAGFEFDFSRSIFNFDAVGQPDMDNCFSGNLDDGMPEDRNLIPRLDAIPDGGRVRVRLRPLTPDRRGRPAYAPIYVRRPHIIPTRVRPYDYEVTGYRDRSRTGPAPQGHVPSSARTRSSASAAPRQFCTDDEQRPRPVGVRICGPAIGPARRRARLPQTGESRRRPSWLLEFPRFGGRGFGQADLGRAAVGAVNSI